MKLRKGDTLLFLGDSVTDVLRDRENPLDLGHGYPLLVATSLLMNYPEHQLTFFNRGIGGNKIADVNRRLETDCLALNPDGLILMIGINDVWWNLEAPTFGEEAATLDFLKEYRELLTRVRKHNPEMKILLLSPFVLPYPEDRVTWRKDLDPKIQVVRQMAKEFQCEYLAMDGRMNELASVYGEPFLTGKDGVHPTTAGNGFLAEAVLSKLTVD